VGTYQGVLRALAPESPIESTLALQDFNYDLSPELIAQKPSSCRDDSRLLVQTAAGDIRHRLVKDLPEEIPTGSLVIVNDSRVIASRLIGQLSTGARIEVFLLELTPGAAPEPGKCRWQALGKPMRKLHEGTKIFFKPGPGSSPALVGTVTSEPDRSHEPPTIGVEFPLGSEAFFDWLEEAGTTPLPPYIHRHTGEPGDQGDQSEAEALSNLDKSRYQTVYANEKGSVAAPTAGLHYTKDLIERLKQERSVEFASVTLHVGAGTFLPVKSENIAQHHMHTERYKVPSDSLKKILTAKETGRPIIVVGTTAFRCLESFWKSAGEDSVRAAQMTDKWQSTDLFVWPRTSGAKYRPWCATALQTNFHQPKSTLLMLVSALAGVENIRNLYQVAIENKYRFFSYGDSTLLWLKPTV
jgi:S-adenosylmethionine:tRNA ribosyltransferase-isomerase